MLHRHVLIFGAVLLALTACAKQKQESIRTTSGQYIGPVNQVALTRAESEVSITGDDSFVTSRERNDAPNRYFELIRFQGGLFTYSRLFEGGYAPEFDTAKIVVDYHNSANKETPALAATDADVHEAKDRYGPYHYVATTDGRRTCFTFYQVFGDRFEVQGGTSSGNQTIRGGACRTEAGLTPEKLSKEMIALIDRLRFDGGELNRAKEAIAQESRRKEAQNSDGKPPTFDEVEEQFRLGNLYRRGDGRPQDYVKAAEAYRRAAEKGHPGAQNNLGVFYRDGIGVKKDLAEAAHWFQLAADQGYPPAQTSLGVMYMTGQGVERNEEKAADLYRAAAQAGLPIAEANLGNAYREGRGVEESMSEAYFWYALAVKRNYKAAARRRDDAAQRLTPEELSAANHRVDTWQPRSETAKASGPPVPATRALSVEWDGLPDVKVGTISLRDDGGDGTMVMGKIAGDETCKGRYLVPAGTKVWQMSCPGGVSATGTFTDFGAGPDTSGRGVDSLGRRVRFTIETAGG